MDIFRYTAFNRFYDIVENSALTLVDPFKCWEDTYEGLFYSAIKDRKIFSALVKYTSHKNDSKKALSRLRLLFSHACSGLRAQSWSLSGDSLQMWTAYSNQRKAIMIISNLEQLDNLMAYNYKISISNNPNGTILPLWSPVNYDITCDEDMCKFIIALFDRTSSGINVTDPLLHKRKFYSYENEVRIFASDTSNKRKYIPLLIEDVTKFIKGVMVHPGAANAHVKKVAEYCSAKGIKFLGKSEIYNKERFMEILQNHIS